MLILQFYFLSWNIPWEEKADSEFKRINLAPQTFIACLVGEFNTLENALPQFKNVLETEILAFNSIVAYTAKTCDTAWKFLIIFFLFICQIASEH